jgi:hypothetical protein
MGEAMTKKESKMTKHEWWSFRLLQKRGDASAYRAEASSDAGSVLVPSATSKKDRWKSYAAAKQDLVRLRQEVKDLAKARDGAPSREELVSTIGWLVYALKPYVLCKEEYEDEYFRREDDSPPDEAERRRHLDNALKVLEDCHKSERSRTND